MDEEKETKGAGLTLEKFSGFAAMAVGYLIARYSGINFLLPMAGAVICWFAISRAKISSDSIFLAAGSVSCGHFLWILLGVAMDAGGQALMFEAGIYAVLILIFIAMPRRRWAAAPLFLYELLSVLINVAVMSGTEFGSSDNKALLTHVVFRSTAVCTLGHVDKLLTQRRAATI